jgi:hypothetical protein
MYFRRHQYVPGIDGEEIHEREDVVVLVHSAADLVTGDDVANQASVQ